MLTPIIWPYWNGRDVGRFAETAKLYSARQVTWKAQRYGPLKLGTIQKMCNSDNNKSIRSLQYGNMHICGQFVCIPLKHMFSASGSCAWVRYVKTSTKWYLRYGSCVVTRRSERTKSLETFTQCNFITRIKHSLFIPGVRLSQNCERRLLTSSCMFVCKEQLNSYYKYLH